jgi:hypothetical protein
MKRSSSLLVLALPILLVACGGGGGGGGVTSSVSVDDCSNPPVVVTPPTTADQNLASGANSFTSNNYDAAIANFAAVLSDTAAPATARAKVSFSLLRSGSTEAALAQLDALRVTSDDAAAAFAATKLQKEGAVSLDAAVTSLGTAVTGTPQFRGAAVATGITAEQARAMLAVLLALRDDAGDAATALGQADLARPAPRRRVARAILAAPTCSQRRDLGPADRP